MTLLWILGSTVSISLISLGGIFVLASRVDIHKLAFYLISLASGVLLGTALLHMIPEGILMNPRHALTLTGAGVLLFFILEKYMVWRHCHIHEHPEDHKRPRAASLVLTSDAIHNFADGMIVASAFLAGIPTGVSVAGAILLHEIPHELGDFGILVHGGYSTRQALKANLMTGLMATVGAALTYYFVEMVPTIQQMLIPVTAGGFLYVSLADLVPQLHEQTDVKENIQQIILFSAGFLISLALKHAAH